MAEFGSLDPNDWREQEAQEGLALQQKDAEALAAKQRSWADTGRGILSAPYRLAKGLGSSGDTGQPATGVANWVGNAASNLGGAIKSGFTAPGDVVSGVIPEYTDGHTSPEMVHRAFDTSAMAGGASFGSKAAAAPVVAADSAKAALPVAAAEHAPPFYSALEHAVAEHPQEVAPAKQWLGTLSNKPGVKPDELKYTGTADMLAKKGDQPVTKAELQDHLEQNKIQLGEVTKGQMPEKWKDVPGDQRYAVSDAYNDLGARHSQPDLPEWYESIAEHSREGHETGLDKIFSPARYADRTLPGGENYREKLLTLPVDTSPRWSIKNAGDKFHVLDENGEVRAWAPTETIAQERMASLEPRNDKRQYRSSHWDEPNVLAHMRMNDRDVTGAGESAAQKALHLEEIQSDWHQQGREKGYVGSEPQAKGEVIHDPEGDPKYPWRVMVDGKEWNRVSGDRARAESELQDGIEAANRRAKSGLLPDAPFKKNWHELALKRALHDAAEGGYERLSWTPGEAQAARYDLSKQVDEIRVAKRPDGNYTLSYLPQGSRDGDYFQPLAKGVAAEKLADHVGKDLAEKILQDKSVDRIGTGTFSGGDLKVGGEGMKGFYDKIVPDYLNKVGKPHGAQVKQGSLHTEVRMYDNEGKPGATFPNMYAAQQWLKRNPQAAEFWSPREGGAPVHYLDIPPSLKQQLLTKGMPLFEDNAAAAPIAAAAHAGEANVERSAANPRGAPGSGGGAGGLEEAQRASARAAGAVQPLAGLPQKPIVLNGESYIPGPIGRVHDVAKQYMEQAGRPYERAEAYRPLDVEHATAIAKAFDEMKHEPSNPRVKASYEALAKETGDQYRAIKQSGLKVEPIRPDMPDPYAANPRLAAKDVAENNHLWFFPTEGGFGAEKGAASAEHPMLRPSGETLNGKPLLNNDLFRIVHDYFGHLKEGNGFRAAGEDNAWRTHSKMYSEAARPAMTTETRGQNSWVNYGPHGETNRTASAADTHYSEQKVGLMPDWTMLDREPMAELRRVGADPNAAPHPGAKYPQYAEQYPPVGPPQLMDKATGKPLPNKGKAAQKLVDKGVAYWGKQLTPQAEAFQKDRSAIQKELETKGYEPFFPPAERSHVDPANYPTPLDMTKDALPAKPATIDKYREMFSTPEAHARLQKAFDVGKTIPGADNWYAMRQLEQQYIKHLGPEEGRKRFATEFAHTMAATTGGADPTSNLLLAHYVQWAQKNHGAIPEASHELPFPIGGRYVSGNIDQFRKMPEGGFTENNPKRHDFGHAFLGHPNKATMDEQMSGGLVPGMSIPPGDSYGVAAQVVHDLAAKNGVHPRDFQDMAWAGLKKLKTEEVGKKFSYKGPMITDVNDAIERTHRLTGTPRNEVVKRGLVKKEIPLYAGGVPMGSLNPEGDQ